MLPCPYDLSSKQGRIIFLSGFGNDVLPNGMLVDITQEETSNVCKVVLGFLSSAFHHEKNMTLPAAGSRRVKDAAQTWT